MCLLIGLESGHYGGGRENSRPHAVISQRGCDEAHIRLRLQTMDSTDPLLALRRAVKSKTPIAYLTDGQPAPTLLAATHLSLGPAMTFPKSSPTRYTNPGISNSPSAADVYTLEAVYLAWLLRDAPGAEYMRQARESGLTVGFVSVTERKSVVEWLEGKVADLERIRPLASGKSVPRPAVRELASVYGFGFRLCCG